MKDLVADDKLNELRRREEEELAMILSQKYSAKYIDLSRVTINSDAIRLIPEKDARDAEVCAFDLVGKRVSFAARAPNARAAEAIRNALTERGYEIILFMVSKASLEVAWSRYSDLSFATNTKEGVIDVSSEDLTKTIAAIKGIEDIQKQIAEVESLKRAYRISRIVEVVMAGAFGTGASDVHIEPEETSVRLRYRLDGVLHEVARFPSDTHQLLLSRVKLLSGLKLNIHDHAQDGRFSIKLQSSEIEVRTSIIPGAYGESIVMRLLDPKTISVPFEKLGMEPKMKALIEKEISRPNGMLLNTGPTGSGKSTTLYACLKRISTPEVKSITIEDPIEYHVAGLVQTQVEKNYSFLQGLRSALRQDPDVIMVGEIRDAEVAQTAIDAALTGHFVFSTLHTNNAAGTFPRLIDLGIDAKVFSSAINIAMAQRLVRVLCEKCKKQVAIPEGKKALIDSALAGLRDKSMIPPDVSHVYEAPGCAECHNTGYKGRIGIFEALVLDKKIDELLRTLPSEREIRAVQKTYDLMLMHEDGIVKALSGITSLEELERVVLLDGN